MKADTWISVTSRERALLLEALSLMTGAEIASLAAKLTNTKPHPNITIGVYGGMVQWTLGNPFPIRICDYDGQSDNDLPDADERGQRCRISIEPANVEIEPS